MTDHAGLTVKATEKEDHSEMAREDRSDLTDLAGLSVTTTVKEDHSEMAREDRSDLTDLADLSVTTTAKEDRSETDLEEHPATEVSETAQKRASQERISIISVMRMRAESTE
jgi:hypothetical protein